MPFSFELWLYLALAFVVTSIVFYLVARISPYEVWSEREPSISLYNSGWFILSWFFRGSEFTPKVSKLWCL